MRRSFDIDLAGVADAEALHDRLAAALPLPQGYGRNLDALHDALTEFGGEWSIVFRNASGAPKGLRAVCRDAVSETPGLRVTFARARKNPSGGIDAGR